MLLQVCKYIRQEGVVSSQQIAREFKIDLFALQPLLDICVKKGMISKAVDALNCKSSCFKCKSDGISFYQVV